MCMCVRAGCSNIRNMQCREDKKTWDLSRFRQTHKTFWPKGHPVTFPHPYTDHWTKMKTRVPDYVASLPAALLKDTVNVSHDGNRTLNCTTSGLLPPLTGPAGNDPVTLLRANSTFKSTVSPQNMYRYRNVFNDRARRGFCYWLVEKKASTCKGYSFGAYKTSLGLPKL